MLYKNKFFDVSVSHKLDEKISILKQYLSHSHLTHEILFFISGNCEYIVGNKKYLLKPYDMLFIPAGTFHHITHLSSARYERVVIQFSPKDLPIILDEIIGKKTEYRNIKGTRVVNLFEKIDDTTSRFSDLSLQYMYKSLIGLLLMEFCKLDEIADNGIQTSPKLTQILYYISSNLDRYLGPDEICKEFYISKSALYKLFTENLNISLMKYIRVKKITIAEQYINEGMLPNQVYEKCGFNDYCTFYRAYKNILGEAPSNKSRKKTKEISNDKNN